MRKGSAFLYGILVLALMGMSISSCMQFLAEGNVAARSFTSKGTDETNAMVLNMQIVETNLAREQMRLYVSPTLTGRFAAGSPRLPAQEIELTLATVNGPRVMMLKRNHHIEPFDIDIPLSDGDILLYPIDRYQGWIEAEAMTAGSGGAQEKVPVVIVLNPRNHAVHVEPRLSRQSETGDTIVRLDISRLFAIQVFTWFMAGVMAVIALSVALVVVNVISGRRQPDFGSLTWSAALLFALPAVRNNLPGAPPLGALIDYSFFFWAEALVGLSMLVLLALWFTTPEPPRT